MASFENYNLPYNTYTTYQNIKYPGLSGLFNMRLDPQFFCFSPRLKIFRGLLLQIVIPHYLCKGE